MKNKEKLILFISILKLSSLLAYNPIESLVTKYDAIVENIVIDQENKMKATTEISTNTQLLIISTGSVMSSEEDYQFKEYFSRSKKEILVGRLLIERFLGNSSYYHSYIETLPKPEEIKDYHHYSETMKEEFNKRSIIKYDWEDRKSNYESLFRKIPTNTIPQLLLNWELYNWAHSIISCHGVILKKAYYKDVKRLSKLNENNPKEDISLVPGINLFRNGPFKSLTGNNINSSLFVYKEHIYLNSDRFIDEGEDVYNEVHFLSNIKLYEMCGKFISGFLHEEMTVPVTNNDWTLMKFDLCKEMDCLPKSKKFSLKYELNHPMLVYCQIDQLDVKDDPKAVYKVLKSNRKVNDANYIKAISKCGMIIKEFIRSTKKTNVENDLSTLQQKGDTMSEKEREIIRFSISQKRLLYYQVKLLNNRLIKEIHRDIMSNLKQQYV